jgi:N-methylhydantoinase B/oxoprolinase/acetone carboxylase alpha subunit
MEDVLKKMVMMVMVVVMMMMMELGRTSVSTLLYQRREFEMALYVVYICI